MTASDMGSLAPAMRQPGSTPSLAESSLAKAKAGGSRSASLLPASGSSAAEARKAARDAAAEQSLARAAAINQQGYTRMLFDRSKTTFEVHTAIRTVEADLPVALKHTRDRLTQLDDLTERVARMQDRLRSSLAPSFLERALEQSGEAALARSIRRVEAPEEPTTRGSTARSSARAGSKGGGGGKDDDDDAWEAKLSKEEDEVARRLQARELDLTTDELASQAVAQWVGGAVARAEDAAAEDEAKRETRSRGRQRALQQRQREQRTVSDGGGAGAAAPGDGGEGGGAGAQLAESLRDAHHRPAAHGLINVLARVTADEDDPAASSAAGGLGLGLVPRGGTLPSLGFGLGGAGLAAGSVPAATWRHDDDLDPAAAAAAAAAAEAREANMRAAALRRAGLAGSLLSQGAGAQEAEARARLLHATAGGPSELRALTVPGTFGARMQLAAMEGEAGPAPPPRQQQGRQQAGARPPRSGGAAAAGGPAARGGPTPGAAAAAGASGPAAAAADRKALDSQTLAKQRLRRKGVPSAEAPAATAGRGMALLPMQPSDIRSHLRALGAPGSASQPSMLRGGLLPTSIRRVQAGDFQPASAGLPLEEQAEQADAEGTPEGAKPAAEEGAGSGPGPADGPPEPRALDPAPALDDGPAEEEAADDEAAAPVLITDRPLRRAPKVEAQVTWEEAQVDASESFGPPGPPQQVQVADKGHDWLAVRWMPPAFDGGSPVVDYVIRYNAIERRFPDGRPAAGEGMDDEPLAQEDEAEAEANADRGEAVPTVVAKPPYRTTQFVGADPIAQSGAVLRGLRPGVWYTDITVTAVTLAGGEGDACVPLEPVRTLSEPPLLSFPQEFELVEVTSRGFDLRWLPPHATHGQRIRHYRLSYTVHSSMLGHDQKPKSKRLVTIKVPAPRQRVTSQAPPRPPPGPAPLAAGLPVFAPLNPLTEADLVARADAEAASQKVRPGDCPYEGAEERGSEREVVARVRGLQGNQRVTGISLVAVSLETGRASAPLELGTDLVTLAPSRRQSVMAELQRVKAIRAHAEKNEDGADASAPLLVDTAFMTAALQRVEAGEYERRLWDELQGLPDAAAEARRKRAEAMRQRQLLLRAQQQARGAGRKQRGRRASISVRQATGQTLAPGGGGGDDDDDDDDALTKLSEAATEAERLAAQAEADMLELATIPVPRGVIEGQAAGRAGSPSRSRQAGPSGRAKLSTPGSRRQGRPASPASAISGLPSEAGSYDSGSDVEPSGATSTPVTAADGAAGHDGLPIIPEAGAGAGETSDPEAERVALAARELRRSATAAAIMSGPGPLRHTAANTLARAGQARRDWARDQAAVTAKAQRRLAAAVARRSSADAPDAASAAAEEAGGPHDDAKGAASGAGSGDGAPGAAAGDQDGSAGAGAGAGAEGRNGWSRIRGGLRRIGTAVGSAMRERAADAARPLAGLVYDFTGHRMAHMRDADGLGEQRLQWGASRIRSEEERRARAARRAAGRRGSVLARQGLLSGGGAYRDSPGGGDDTEEGGGGGGDDEGEGGADPKPAAADDLSGLDDRQLLRRAAERMEDGGGVGRLRRVQTFRVGRMHTWGRGEGGDIAVKDHDPGVAGAKGLRQQRQAKGLEVSRTAADRRQRAALERAEAMLAADEAAEAKKRQEAKDDVGSRAPSASAAAASASKQRSGDSGARGGDRARRASVASVEETFSVLAGWRPPEDPDSDSDAEPQGAAAFEAAVEAAQYKRDRRGSAVRGRRGSSAGKAVAKDGEAVTGKVRRGHRRASAARRRQIDTTGAKDEIARQARRRLRQREKERRAKRRMSIIAGRRDAPWLTAEQKDYLIRRQQFLERIQAMRKLAEEADAGRRAAEEEVRELARTSQSERARIGRILVEVSRAARGEAPSWVIMSRVRTGAPQEFDAGKLIQALADEAVALRSVLLARARRAWVASRRGRELATRCRVLIASADAKKAALMQLTRSMQAAERAQRGGGGAWLQRGFGLAMTQAKQAEAQEAGTTASAASAERGVALMTSEEKKTLRSLAFTAWVEKWREAKQEKAFLRSIILRMLRRQLAEGFGKWVTAAREVGEWWTSGGGLDGSSKGKHDPGGKGTRELGKAEGARQGMMATAARVLEDMGRGNEALQLQRKAERWQDTEEAADADEDSDAGSVVGDASAEEKRETKLRRAIGLGGGAADIISRRRALANKETSGALLLATGGAAAAAQAEAAQNAREFAVPGRLRLAQSLEERTLQRRLLRRLFKACTVWEPAPPNEAAILAAEEFRAQRQAEADAKARARRERAEKYKRVRLRQARRHQREERLQLAAKAGVRLELADEDPELASGSGSDAGDDAEGGPQGTPRARGAAATGGDMAIVVARPRPASPPPGLALSLDSAKPPASAASSLTASKAVTPYTEQVESDGGLVFEAAMGQAGGAGGGGAAAGDGRSSAAERPGTRSGLAQASDANTPFFAHVAGSAFFRAGNYQGAQKQYAKLAAVSEDSIAALRGRVRAIASQARHLARRVRVGVAKRIQASKAAAALPGGADGESAMDAGERAAFSADVTAGPASPKALPGADVLRSEAAGRFVVDSDGDSEEESEEDEDETDGLGPLGFRDASSVFDGNGSPRDSEALGELEARWNDDLPPPATVLGAALSAKARDFVKTQGDMQPNMSVGATPGAAGAGGFTAPPPSLRRMSSRGSMASSAGGGSGGAGTSGGPGLQRAMSSMSLSSLGSQDREAEVVRRGWGPLVAAGLVVGDALDAMVQLKARLVAATGALEAEELRRRALALRACECAAMAGDLAVALDGYSRLRQGLEREGDAAGAAVVCERECWLAARRGQLQGAKGWAKRAQNLWREVIEVRGEASRAALGLKLGTEIMWLVGGSGKVKGTDTWLFASVADARAVRLGQGRAEAARGLGRCVSVEECLCAITGDEAGAAQARMRRSQFGLGPGGDGFGVLHAAPAAVPAALLLDGAGSVSASAVAGESALAVWRPPGQASSGSGSLGAEASQARDAIRARREAAQSAQSAASSRKESSGPVGSTSKLGVRGLLEAAKERRRQSVAQAADSAGEAGGGGAPEDASGEGRAPGSAASAAGAGSRDAVALEQRLAAAAANLSALAVRLQKAVAKVLPDLALEQVSAAVPPLRAKVRACRRMIAGLEKAISEMQARRTELGDATEEDAALLAVLRSTTATHIDVAVAGGAAAAAEAKKARQRGAVVSTQRMTVAEARFLIQTRLEMAERERDELQRRVGVAEVRIRNLSDTLSDLSKELAASTGALASAALGRRAVRSACFYQWNALGNQVMGRGRVWAMDGAGGEVEVICPNCGGAQVMGGGRGRSPLTDEDLAGGGAGGARAKLLALRRARAERAAAASGGQTKTGVSSNAGGGRNRGAKAGKGAAADDAPWERTPLAKYVSANGRALRKSTSAVVGAARVAQSAAKLAAAAAGGAADGASAAAAAEGDNGEVDSFSLLTGGGAKSVGMEAVASEGRQVFDDEEDEEAEEREGIEAGSVQCSQCKFVLGGALLGLCPYMAAVQGDDVVIHRVFRGPGEAAAEERRYKGRMGEGRAETQELAPGQRPKKAAASEHPLARLRLLRERTQKRAALLEKLVGAAGRKNKSAAQAAAAALFREEEAGDDSDDEASAASALRAQLARAPPIVTKAVRVIPGNWKALLARGVRGLGRDGGLSRDKRMALLVAAGRMGNRTLVEHFAGAVEAGGGVPGKEAEEEAAEGQDAASKDKDKAKAKGKPAGGSAAADGKQDVQAVASRVARGLISVEDAEKERKRLEETHAAYLATLRAGHGRAVTCVAMTATRVFTGSADATIRAWNWRTGDVVGEMVGHRGTVTCLALDVDARTLLSGSSDGTARLWDTLSFRCLRTLRKHEGGITCVAIFRDMFVTGSADRSVGVWDLASKPLRNEAADELEALAEFKMKQEGDWAFQLREAVEQEKKLERKLDNDEASDDEEREAMGRPARGSESESINSDDLFETSSESSELSDGEDGEDEDSGDVSTTDSEDSTREARITVWEKEQRLLDRLVGDREAPRPNELKVRINAKGRLAGVGYKTFTRGGAYRARQMREKRDNSKLTRREREKAIKRGENRVAQARRAGGEDAPLEDEDELTLTDMFQNLRSNMRARRDALKRFQKMRVAEKRKRRRRRFRIRRLAATKTRRRQLQSQINTERRKAEQRMLSLQRRVTSQSGPGAFSEGDGVIRVTAESLGFDINMSADTLQAVAHLPRHNLLLDVHTAAITSVCLTTPFVVSGDAIGVVIIWDVVRAVPLRVIDTQPDMPLPPRTTLPMPRILQEDFSNIQGVVGVVRRRRKLPDGRVVTYTAGQEADLAGLGATGLSPEDLGGLTVAGAAAGKRDLAAEAASSSSEDEDELRAKEQQRLAAMSGRERAKERARILEGQIARRFFLEALTGLPTRLLDGDASDEDLGDEDLAARAIVQQAGAAVAAALPPSLPRGPRMPWDADKLWRLDPESLMMGRQPGEDPVDVKLERRERARRRRLRRKQRAVAIADGDFGDGAAAEEDAGADSSGDDDPIARADAAAKAAREAIKAAERRFPVLSLFADPRRVAVGVGSGEVQMFDLISLERVATLHPAEMREGEAVSGDIGRRQLRMLRGTLVMDSGKVMAAYNDGRVRRWEIYTGDGDEEAAVESEGKAGAGGGRRAAAPAASRKSAASVGGVAVGAGGGSLA
ncbi:hypothetical protein FNF31_02890 [Cafeteria roenbergensis]|uniref:Fibronectin type-III domain-containing protein n=1 Tax=Cafeteria roenbergensis TaxID=33653 RepID=A0A5A8DDM9_CAFRO|nr:hypothetical protein FNF31_02890 [Cafeteria roenbergensis]